MIKIYPYNQLGEMKIDWLHARYHFSFADYHNPNRRAFGKLRVINDDTVKAGSGFGKHPHRDMEIITYVRQGAITHTDSEGNEGVTKAGDVQVMSAGSGIFHSEVNAGTEDTRLYQIWIEPHTKQVTPRWDMMQFPKDFVTDALPLLVSGRTEDAGKPALAIHQYASICGGRMKKDTKISHPIHDQLYILVARGQVAINNILAHEGDGVEVTELTEVTFHAITDCEIVVIDVPA